MKTVLITNLYFAKYTGSELHALEIAQLFKKWGYEVTIAVFEKAYPLIGNADGIQVVECLTEDLEKTEFNVVFVQHYPVFDYLCCKYDISCKKLIVSKLSVINDLEYLPICTPKADLILCVSEECAEQVYQEIGYDKRVKVFKNSVSESCFVEEEQRERRNKVEKIAIISNHVPKELLELSEVMQGSCMIDYIGAEYEPRLVNADLLRNYDLVITIGRTVQQCFALKIPVYVYDYFGGPGYINDINFALAEKNNFSGRGGFERKTAEELKADIEDNYQINLGEIEKLYSIAKEEYNYVKNFEQIYQELMSDNNTEYKVMDFYKEDEKKRMIVYGNAIPSHRFSKRIFSQLYVDYGEGLKEEDSIKWYASENYIITRSFEINKRVNALRFDPCDIPAKCYIYEVRIGGQIKEEYSNKTEDFLHYDPQFIIELSEEEKASEKMTIEISYRFKGNDCREASMLMQNQLQRAENEVFVLTNTIEEIREYYKITPRNIMKRLLGFLKK